MSPTVYCPPTPTCGGLSRAWKASILRRAFAEPIDFLRRMLFRRRLLCERKCQVITNDPVLPRIQNLDIAVLNQFL